MSHNIAQYPINYVNYACAKFEVTKYNDLGDRRN